MPPFRIPFTSRRPPGPQQANGLVTDENAPPNGNSISSPNRDKPSLALGIKGSKDAPNEFKMSSVNDSGEYLPPSPQERPSFWGKSPHSTASSNHRSVFSENEPFSISRESFESYRRSFDVSGRSPIIHSESFHSRSSMDSRSFRPLPRSAIGTDTFERPPLKEVDGFEDVGLNDEPKPKKKTFLSRFGDSSETAPTPAGEQKPGHHFHILGRKRGQSGSGSELGNIERPTSKGKAEVTKH